MKNFVRQKYNVMLLRFIITIYSWYYVQTIVSETITGSIIKYFTKEKYERCFNKEINSRLLIKRLWHIKDFPNRWRTSNKLDWVFNYKLYEVNFFFFEELSQLNLNLLCNELKKNVALSKSWLKSDWFRSIVEFFDAFQHITNFNCKPQNSTFL